MSLLKVFQKVLKINKLISTHLSHIKNYVYYKKILSFLRIKNLKINNLVVSDVIETKNFYERSISSHSSLYENPQIEGLSSVKRVHHIKATTLDQYCNENEIEKLIS